MISPFGDPAAFRFGPYAAHFSLVPISEEQQQLKKAAQYSSSDAYSVLRDHIRDFFSGQSAKYVFRAQFVSDTSKQSVEDSSTAWDEFFSPWHDLAIVEFPSQETFSDARRSWWDNKIALSPFNGLKDHQPLGSVNRLRRRVYQTSRQYRAEKNAGLLGEPYFPQTVDEMPDDDMVRI